MKELDKNTNNYNSFSSIVERKKKCDLVLGKRF